MTRFTTKTGSDPNHANAVLRGWGDGSMIFNSNEREVAPPQSSGVGWLRRVPTLNEATR